MEIISTIAQFNALPNGAVINSKYGSYWTDDKQEVTAPFANTLRELSVGLDFDGYVASSKPFYLFKKKDIPDSLISELKNLLSIMKSMPKYRGIKQFKELCIKGGITFDKSERFSYGSYWGGTRYAKVFILNGICIPYHMATNVNKDTMDRVVNLYLQRIQGKGS